jgi:hypothetical protein
MARPATGSIAAETLGDGTLAFRLRFRVRGKRETVYLHEARACDCGCGGGWNERTAAVELENVLARVKAGVWTPPQQQDKQIADDGVPTFHEYSSRWLQARIDGVIGEKPIRPTTAAKYRWRIESHLLPFLASYRLDEIDRDLCLAFKAHLLKQSRELRESIDAGADIRDGNGRRVKPLGPASMRMVIDGLVAILDDAVEDGHIGSNPARRRPARSRAADRAGPVTAAAYNAAHAQTDLHLDRTVGQQLRRQVGHEPGGPRRLEDDDGRLRAAATTCPARPRSEVRQARPGRSQAPSGRSRAAPGAVRWDGEWDGRAKKALRAPLARSEHLHKTPRFAGHSRVGDPGLEPGTSSLSEKRSNRLS